MTAYSHHAGGFTDQGGHAPDNLVAGAFPAVQRIETITGGAAYPRGAVLGRITASGLYTLSVAAAKDGSQKPAAILAEPVDTTSGNAKAVVYHSGEFNGDALTYGAGHDAASVWNSFRIDGPSTIFPRKNQEA